MPRKLNEEYKYACSICGMVYQDEDKQTALDNAEKCESRKKEFRHTFQVGQEVMVDLGSDGDGGRRRMESTILALMFEKKTHKLVYLVSPDNYHHDKPQQVYAVDVFQHILGATKI